MGQGGLRFSLSLIHFPTYDVINDVIMSDADSGREPRSVAASFSFTRVFTRATVACAGIGCVCMSVVRLSQVGVLLKRFNVGSRKDARRQPGLYSSFIRFYDTLRRFSHPPIRFTTPVFRKSVLGSTKIEALPT